MKRLRIVGLVNGGATPFDNQWLVSYDPDYHWPDGTYDGGDLRTSPDEADARQFPSAKEAILYWRQSHGTRIDGKPNRPLTAFDAKPQSVGSAITYARRYGLSGLLGITADDDDGNAASGVGRFHKTETPRRNATQPNRNPSSETPRPQPTQAAATPKPADAILESLLKRQRDNPDGSEVYVELCDHIRELNGDDAADIAWSKAVELHGDPAIKPVFGAAVIKFLYSTLQNIQKHQPKIGTGTAK